MTKNELKSKVPSVSFNGKKKQIWANSATVDYNATQYLALFCLLTGYKLIYND